MIWRGVSYTSMELRPPGAVQWVVINVSDLESSAAFYRDLGFDGPRSAAFATNGSGGGGKCLRLTLTNARWPQQPSLVLQQFVGGPTAPAITRAHDAGLSRLALSCADIPAAVERLSSRGFRFLSEPIVDTPPGSIETTIVAVLDPVGPHRVAC